MPIRRGGQFARQQQQQEQQQALQQAQHQEQLRSPATPDAAAQKPPATESGRDKQGRADQGEAGTGSSTSSSWNSWGEATAQAQRGLQGVQRWSLRAWEGTKAKAGGLAAEVGGGVVKGTSLEDGADVAEQQQQQQQGEGGQQDAVDHKGGHGSDKRGRR
mmetsp:Transcript_15539/g.42115  ORF Transcript_15539/g.42115 Transcript_15539/m.42115 type:complete len:160 (-) Transcript_15539:485-964(-)